MNLNHPGVESTRSWQTRVWIIAAVLLIALLVGTSILLFTRSRHSGFYGFKLHSGWHQVALYHGTGNATITPSQLELPTVWGYSSACQGTGKLDIDVRGNQYNGVWGNERCDSPSVVNAPSGISLELSTATIQTLTVRADTSTVWSLQIAAPSQPPFSPGPGWVPSGGLGASKGRAEGNVLPPQTKDGHELRTKRWGVVLVCLGSSSHGFVELTPSVGKINFPTCNGQPQLRTIDYPVVTQVQYIEGEAVEGTLWYVMLLARQS